MTPSEIKPGMKFGHWEVIKYDHTNDHRIKYFLCKCDVCGTIRPVRSTGLLDGTSTSCSRACSNSLVGQKFGRWTVLRRTAGKPKYYDCVCECGTKRAVYGPSLKYGKSLSCGCLKSEKTKQRNKENAEARIGKKFGMLTILDAFVKELKDGKKRYYHTCQCDCGNQVVVSWTNLQSGNTYSCGCINSFANAEMARILSLWDIKYKQEYKFEDCKDVRPLPFDFALFNEEDELIGLIENNGDQHYSTRGTQWNTPERLEYIQKHDYIKQKFCEDNHIPLLIIPYQYFHDLENFLITSDFWKIISKQLND